MIASKDNMFDCIRRKGDIGLTLFNTYQESHEAHWLTDFAHQKKGIRLRWELDKMHNVSPFTYAMIHDGSRIFTIFSIRPVLDHEAQSIEVLL